MFDKKAIIATALLIAGSSIGVAQTTPSAPSPTPPATAPTPAPTTPSTGRSTAGSSMFYTHQADDVRASKLIGTRVVNAANETVGDINEVILTNDGKVAAVVVGVGGFLGIGERQVAVSYQSLRVSRDSNSNLVISMDATKESLKSAPAWAWNQPVK